MLKRTFDVSAALVLTAVLSVPMAVIAVLIKLDSPGPVMFRQERVTAYGKRFRIHKFRTMDADADKIGTAVTVVSDARITRIGAKLRAMRLDELPQLLDILHGDMSFVGTRPEVPKYVELYQPEYNATLLLPAGITSEASIRFKNEAELLVNAEDADRTYMETILPGKMRLNLADVREFSVFGELKTMIRTVLAVVGKDYN
ncbi:MAG: sugar transferase [Clostridia bacterium]|nr:sugar transferase [Clostridia bacterium]